MPSAIAVTVRFATSENTAFLPLPFSPLGSQFYQNAPFSPYPPFQGASLQPQLLPQPPVSQASETIRSLGPDTSQSEFGQSQFGHSQFGYPHQPAQHLHPYSNPHLARFPLASQMAGVPDLCGNQSQFGQFQQPPQPGSLNSPLNHLSHILLVISISTRISVPFSYLLGPIPTKTINFLVHKQADNPLVHNQADDLRTIKEWHVADGLPVVDPNVVLAMPTNSLSIKLIPRSKRRTKNVLTSRSKVGTSSQSMDSRRRPATTARLVPLRRNDSMPLRSDKPVSSVVSFKLLAW